MLHTNYPMVVEAQRRDRGALPEMPASRRVGRGTADSQLRELPPALRALLNEAHAILRKRREDEESGSVGDSGGVVAISIQSCVMLGAARLGLSLTQFEVDLVAAHLEADEQPFSILQPLVDDPSVSDIIVSHYARITVQQGRRNVGTDLAFPSEDDYLAFVERLLRRAGASYSTKRPIADGMIGEFARIHAVHKLLCESGPYLTIRLNRFSRVGVHDLARSGMAPRVVLDYLSSAIHCGQTLLIVGEVGTGKTTLARALAASVPEDESILVIEDTPELKLDHPHVRYITTREANGEGVGKVSPAECIRGGMRMAMNRVIFGEIRDAEAAEAFIDVCASGHPGLSTIHARSAMEAVRRLELFLGRAQRGVAREVVTDQVVSAVQILVHVAICKRTGVRRIFEVREIGPVADGVIRQREIFRYDAAEGDARWRVVTRMSNHRDLVRTSPGAPDLTSLPAVLRLSEVK